MLQISTGSPSRGGDVAVYVLDINQPSYRKILHISYKDLVTNEEVRAKIQHAIGLHEDLLTIVKRRKLQWYGHVSHSSGLEEVSFEEETTSPSALGTQRL